MHHVQSFFSCLTVETNIIKVVWSYEFSLKDRAKVAYIQVCSQYQKLAVIFAVMLEYMLSLQEINFSLGSIKMLCLALILSTFLQYETEFKLHLSWLDSFAVYMYCFSVMINCFLYVLVVTASVLLCRGCQVESLSYMSQFS